MVPKNLISLFACLFTIIPLIAQIQPNSYNQLWQKTDTLIIKRGLTESALTEVNKIHTMAVRDKNDPQIIKTLLYKQFLYQQKDDDAMLRSIVEFEKQAADSKEPVLAVLNSILADTYWKYFQQNRWKFYNTTPALSTPDDPETWSAEDFHKKISALYLKSLSSSAVLQTQPLELFEPILIKGNSRKLRPTLYDLLAHKALEYFQNDERLLNKPSYSFIINKAAAYADADTFITHTFNTIDTASLYLKSLHIYKELLRFHKNDKDPSAMIDADLKRLRFVHSVSVVPGKDELFLKSLQELSQKYTDAKYNGEILLTLAKYHFEKAGTYQPLGDTTYRFSYVTAKTILDKLAADTSDNIIARQAKNLLNEINQKDLFLQVEKVNVPLKPFRMLATFKNVPQAYFRILKMGRKEKETIGLPGEKEDYWQKLLALPVMYRFEQKLPFTGDHQQHKVEIPVQSLPAGSYAIISSSGNEFSLANNQSLSVTYFHVSNNAYINNGEDFFVLHRETGQPISNASVQIWNRRYDSKALRYNLVKGEKQLTDKNGFFRMKNPSGSNYNQLLEVAFKNDTLFLDEETNTYRYFRPHEKEKENRREYEKKNMRTFLFTDRSIYRPGQTVFFKGITITKDFETRKWKVISGYQASIILFDANYQAIDTLKLISNAYGSFNGKFILPERSLNGSFQIESDESNGSVSFSVEEYKRPTFYIQYKTPEKTFRLNDTVVTHAIAKGYAGTNIPNARVIYRVTREARFPYPWIFRKRGIPHSDPQEIAYGTTTTDNNGSFTISFPAIPDLTVSKELEPVFDYRVSAEVTDNSGETRGENQIVRIGYKSLNVQINLPQPASMPVDSLKNISIRTENHQGDFIPAAIELSLYRLQSPSRLIRERLWDQPDQFILTREDYIRLFPNDEYSDETNMQGWERSQKIFTKTDSTSPAYTLNLVQKDMKPGWYLIEAIATDRFGDKSKGLSYVELRDPETNRPASPSYNWIPGNIIEAAPGEKITTNIGSSAENVFVITLEDKPQDDKTAVEPKTEYGFIKLGNESKPFSRQITDGDVPGLSIKNVFIKDNRMYTSSTMIRVPFTDKNLHITYETFRDRTLPGSNEKWKIKISGNKTDAIAAEVLTAMYDSSLDQFRTHSWQIPAIYPGYYSGVSWHSRNFEIAHSTERYIYTESSFDLTRTYDRIGIIPEVSSGYYNRDRIKTMAVAQKVEGRDAGMELQATDSVVAYNVAESDMQETPAAPLPEKRDDKNGASQIPVQLRSNFNETAFFLPELTTDSSGNIEFSFTAPDAVTTWKWMVLAHTKDLAFGYSEKSLITQKQLMVQPNAPRFLREGDRMDFSGKISNLSGKELTGQVELQLIDPVTNTPVDGWFMNMFPNQYFTAAAGESVPVRFTVEIPFNYARPVIYRMIARSDSLSDGVQAMLPVITNRILITESLPLPIRGTSQKQFNFDNLLKSDSSETRKHHALTVEFTSNPAWYAVQSLPYLKENTCECTDQIFNRYYANALASKIARSVPRLQEMIEKWNISDTGTLLSNLQKNQELKSVLLQETPWVLEAKSETEQRKNLVILFDLIRLQKELSGTLETLKEMQKDNGAFVWMKGGFDDRYITQQVVTSIGRLLKLGAVPDQDTLALKLIADKAMAYLDSRILQDYAEARKRKTSAPGLGYAQIQYLYMRSFFIGKGVRGDVFAAYNYYRSLSQNNWRNQNRYMQGMIAISLFRTGDVRIARNIVASLKENAIKDEEMGMYWKNQPGYWWYQAPVETHVLLAETFHEVMKDQKSVDEINTWLLKNKQTTGWETNRATADAVYALLLSGDSWTRSTPQVTVQLGEIKLPSTQTKSVEGTGYFKERIEGDKVKAEMGSIQVFIKSDETTPAARPAWGAVHWQYFEDLDRVKTAATPLQLKKALFVSQNTDKGPVLKPLADGNFLKIGDKLVVRIELRVDREMEYVHMKDMRASALEPVNVISSYKWQGGLGYYESTKDASTSFFFDYLRKGTYVFEYSLFATHSGTFTNGITTIESMYAPEFRSHSESVKLHIEGE